MGGSIVLVSGCRDGLGSRGSACQQAEIEKQIASYGDGQVADLERKVRDAELEVEQAADLLGQAQGARDARKARLNELRANRPRESA